MEELAERIRKILFDDPNISERKMFGGVCFMLNGNMLCGPTNSGMLMVRVGKDLEDEARSKPHTREMDFTGKPMKGFIYVEEDGLQNDDDIRQWMAFATQFVGKPPAK